MTLQESLTNKERRMLKAARKRYAENKDLQTVADELNLAYQTVRGYFSGDDMKRFKRFYSESDIQLLQSQVESMVRDGTKGALDLKSDLLTDDSVDARTKLKLMRESQEIAARHIEMLQELGVLEKPGSSDGDESDSGDVVFEEELVETREELKQDS